MRRIYNQKAKIAHCSLNQSALDFTGNKKRIIRSIKKAKELGCRFRTCQELEIPGYSCEDHFREMDTFTHSWQVITDLLKDPELTKDIIVLTSMPVYHRGATYNCVLILHDQQVLGIRPKTALAGGENYREERYFCAYQHSTEINGNLDYEEYQLPIEIEKIKGQKKTPFGLFNLKTQDDVIIGFQICEEAWRMYSISSEYMLDCDLVFSANASHFEAEKLALSRVKVIQSQTIYAFRGAYFYSNVIGCDGSRLVFDGANMVLENGKLVYLGDMCPLVEMVVDPVVVNIGKIKRNKIKVLANMKEASELKRRVPLICLDFELCSHEYDCETILRTPIEFQNKYVEILQCMTTYAWDYLRKSGASGFFLPLSGGSDSGITALAVFLLASRLMKILKREPGSGKSFHENVMIEEHRQDTLKELRRVVKDEKFEPEKPQDIVKKILHTRYLGTDNSSEETKLRAEKLAKFIGSNHESVSITPLFKKFKDFIKTAMDMDPKFKTEGGQWQEDLALQNIQARVRMVTSYVFAQLLPTKLKIPGYLLVLSSGNIDESLVGYSTKYDNSSGDISLIGSLNKTDIRAMMDHLNTLFEGQDHSEVIKDIMEANPSAELTPLIQTEVVKGKEVVVPVQRQTDEDDIGLSYEEIRIINHLRNVELCGMVSIFESLCDYFPEKDPKEIRRKVDIFYKRYMRNRHKSTVMTPSVHLTGMSCDDNRFDLRPFLYDTGKDSGRLEFQGEIIDTLVEKRLKVSNCIVLKDKEDK